MSQPSPEIFVAPDNALPTTTISSEASTDRPEAQNTSISKAEQAPCPLKTFTIRVRLRIEVAAQNPR
jgi:hypothetical protein